MPDEAKDKPQEAVTEITSEPKKKSKKKLLIILVLLFLFGLVACGLIAFYIYTSQQTNPCSGGNPGCGPLYTPTPSAIVTPTIAATNCGDSGPASLQRVAFITDGNVWISNNDGTGKIDLTNDANGEIQYFDAEWCGSNSITYARCINIDSCEVINHNISSGVKTTLFSVVNERIVVLEWSHDGSILASMTTDSDSVDRISFFKDGTNTVVKTFPAHLGRGTNFEDGLSLEFSTDNEVVVALRTFLGAGETRTISIFKADGTELNGIESPGTHPALIPGETGLYYAKSGNIMKLPATGPEVVATSAIIGPEYNLAVSANGKYIAFWLAADSAASLGMYAVGGPSSEVHMDLSYPKWLNADDKELIVTKTLADSESIDGYSTTGLYKFNRVTGTVTTIDTAQVFNFDIER